MKAALPSRLTLFSLLLATGCGQTSSSGPAGAAATHADRPTSVVVNGSEHKHDGWWCDEHGVPEDVCGQCNAKVAAEFQKKGDWCQEHDRPASQCFACHPELEGTFAARYEAKYGKKPPKPQSAEEHAHRHDDHARS